MLSNNEDTVTVICINGWKYTGQISRVFFSFLGVAGWFKLRTKNQVVILNERHIVSIIKYDNAS